MDFECNDVRRVLNVLNDDEHYIHQSDFFGTGMVGKGKIF